VTRALVLALSLAACNTKTPPETLLELEPMNEPPETPDEPATFPGEAETMFYHELYVEPYADKVKINLRDVRETPAAWDGKRVEGRVAVQRTVTPRGFYLSDLAENELFVIVLDQPDTELVAFESGTELLLEDATIRVPDGFDDKLAPNAETMAIASEEPAFLVVSQGEVRVVDPPADDTDGDTTDDDDDMDDDDAMDDDTE